MLTCGAMLRESGTKLEKFKDKEQQVAVVNNLAKFPQEPLTILETPCSQPENTTK